MPREMKQAFVDAVKAFPHIQFIWKYEEPEDGIIEKLPNLYTAAWLPQPDILGMFNFWFLDCV